MKFLVVVEGVPGGAPMTPEQWLVLAKANLEWVRKMKASRKVEATYAMADHAGGFMGGVGIVNYDSAEQIAEDGATMPAAGLSTTKMYPLVDFELLEKFVEEAEKSISKK